MANNTLAENINRIADSVTYYNIIINLAVGVPLNLLNTLVFARLMLNKTNKTNMGFLGLSQSIIDIIKLLYYSLEFQSTIIKSSDAICKLLNFMRRIISCASSWMQVITTFDRFVYVILGYRGRFRFMNRKAFLALIIFAVLFLLALVNIINLFYYISRDKCTADHLILIASDIVLISTRLYIPIFLMIVFNMFMIRIVLKKSRNVSRQSSNVRKEHHFTISVMANDAFYLLLALPLSVYFILYDINLYSGALNGNALFAAKYMLFSNISKAAALSNQSFSFFINLAFNKLYRREVLNLIGKVIKFKRNSSDLVRTNTKI